MKNLKIMVCCLIMAVAAVSLPGCSGGAGVNTSHKTKETEETKQETTQETKQETTVDLPQSGTIGGYRYSVLDNGQFGYLAIKSRGYYIDSLDEPNAPFFIVICSGERNTGGYGIQIADLEMDGETLVITVDETDPDPMSMVTQAITYPYCVLEIDSLPDDFRVVTTEGEELHPSDA